MVNINFVPDDYVENNESRRTNLVYLMLFAVMMAALGGSFVLIKMRQKACRQNERRVSEKMSEIQESIKQFEQLQEKRRVMMKTALTTAELLEPVPRSVLLASLTNNLPDGVSLMKLNLIQKRSAQTSTTTTTSKYRAKKKSASGGAKKGDESENPEKFLETHIAIGGTALNDLQVASYIEHLTNSTLLDNVALIESKECKLNDKTFRQFKLTAMLTDNVHLSRGDVEKIRDKATTTVWSF
ncbi:MAG: PilN domain-containing protein [Planctomycetota bacterium]|jgi:Tfp pilus assembly protein PilN